MLELGTPLNSFLEGTPHQYLEKICVEAGLLKCKKGIWAHTTCYTRSCFWQSSSSSKTLELSLYSPGYKKDCVKHHYMTQWGIPCYVQMQVYAILHVINHTRKTILDESLNTKINGSKPRTRLEY